MKQNHPPRNAVQKASERMKREETFKVFTLELEDKSFGCEVAYGTVRENAFFSAGELPCLDVIGSTSFLDDLWPHELAKKFTEHWKGELRGESIHKIHEWAKEVLEDITSEKSMPPSLG